MIFWLPSKPQIPRLDFKCRTSTRDLPRLEFFSNPIVPNDSKTIEICMQLEEIGDFLEAATNDEKYKIFHILFDPISFLKKIRSVRIKSHTDFIHIFRLAASLTSWIEADGFI
jgi:hypothetical protein